MIVLHRLGHPDEPFHLNPELIQTVEANPDTVLTLTTHARVVVAEEPETVAALMREHRIDILTASLRRAGRRARAIASAAPLFAVEGPPPPADQDGR